MKFSKPTMAGDGGRKGEGAFKRLENLNKMWKWNKESTIKIWKLFQRMLDLRGTSLQQWWGLEIITKIVQELAVNPTVLRQNGTQF